MSSESSWVVERFGRRGARYALAASAVVFIALIAGWAAFEISAALAAGHALRGILIGLVALLLVGLSLRIMRLNWRATRAGEDQPVVLPDGNDQSGIWGVGGPSMREPGSTGAWPSQRIVDRRYGEADD